MSPKATAPTAPACSFCGKEAAAVSKIIAGPGIFICDECVGLCNDILAGAEESDEPARSIPYWAGMTDEQILDHLPKVARVSAQVDSGVQAIVDLLRDRGVAWARIGAAMGVARQTAWEKYAAAE